jgi:C4-dicarboxylate transporter
MHILFCSYIFGCPKQATTRITHLRSITSMLTRSILGQKINKKKGSSSIYLIEEQYHQVKNLKSFDLQNLGLIFI